MSVPTSEYEYGAVGLTVGICAAMIAAIGLVAAIAIMQNKDAEAEQKLREQIAERARGVK